MVGKPTVARDHRFLRRRVPEMAVPHYSNNTKKCDRDGAVIVPGDIYYRGFQGNPRAVLCHNCNYWGDNHTTFEHLKKPKAEGRRRWWSLIRIPSGNGPWKGWKEDQQDDGLSYRDGPYTSQ